LLLFREGVFNALAVVREGFDETARTLTEAATSEHARRGGLTGAVGGVLRQVPSTMMRPVIIGTTATVNLLEGVQSQVAPDIRDGIHQIVIRGPIHLS
jgi:autophagy-related protein 2